MPIRFEKEQNNNGVDQSVFQRSEGSSEEVTFTSMPTEEKCQEGTSSHPVPEGPSLVSPRADAGYIFRNTIIWDRRNIVNRIGIFGWPSSYITMGTTFEYILDFTI